LATAPVVSMVRIALYLHPLPGFAVLPFDRIESRQGAYF
jgi:hypothetical protein